jgi:hypothetical protein
VSLRGTVCMVCPVVTALCRQVFVLCSVPRHWAVFPAVLPCVSGHVCSEGEAPKGTNSVEDRLPARPIWLSQALSPGHHTWLPMSCLSPELLRQCKLGLSLTSLANPQVVS